MYLKYIEIQGFKSFPDKTKIEFEKGLTAIVGPNGSGKSNISDAIRWVLGEQSSKSLRGNKMEDIVFDGSKNRGAMGYASVNLCLDNSDGRIADVGNNLVVGRRYYRSGDSEYTINGAAARLRDVREMFMDTGLGRDGYSIIGQGRIDAVVSAKNNERREIFEEASGIAKYRFRKEEAARKLELAEENIDRIKDILGELSARLGPLENQSKKAREFLKLSEQRRGLEITLYCDTVRRSQDQLREQDTRLAVARSDYENISAKLSEYENLLEHNSELTRTYSAAVDRLNAEINELVERQGQMDGELAVLENDLAHSEAEHRRIEAELASFGAADSEIAADKERLSAEIGSRTAELSAQDTAIAEADALLSDIIAGAENSDRERGEASRRLAEVAAAITDLKVEEVSHRSSAEANDRRAAAIEQQSAEAGGRLSELSARLGEAEKASAAVRAEVARIENIKGGYQLKLKTKNEAMKAVNDELNKSVFASDECLHRIRALSELERSMDGFAGSVRRVVGARDAREIRGIIGTVASLITIESGWEVAIEAALGAALQNIIVEDESAAKDAIAFLKNTRAGRATFLPVTTIRPSHFDGELGVSGVVGLASSLVKCEARYADIVSSMLGRIIVAKDIDSAAEVARVNRYRFRAVTEDGQLVNAGGSFTGGFIAKGSGVLSRRTEINEQQEKLARLKASVQQCRERAAAESAEAAKITAELTALESDLINRSEEKIKADALYEGIKAQHDGLAATLSGLEAERASLAAESVAHRAESARAEAERLQLEKQAEGLSERANLNSPADYIEKRAAAQERLSDLKLRRMEMQKDCDALTEALEALNSRASGMDAKRSDAERLTQLARELVEVKRLEIEKKRAGLLAVADDVAYKRAEIADCIEKRQQKEAESTRLRAEERESVSTRERLGSETARLEERRGALLLDHERTVARLWEDYELTPAEAQSQCVPFERVADLKKEVGDIRQKIKSLGQVNVGSIDEYKAVLERHSFLKEQYDDVNNSRNELIGLIDSLTGEMKSLFDVSFKKIAENFTRVFTELFGGGTASLYLTDENDVLESGIEIDAHPPGKVIKNLSSLSGGEKALVAIALYFAILSVNPSPFCVLDEIDTALDDSNVLRFAQYINRITEKTQFLAITHRRGTMENAAVLYGVTMQEEGVSKLLRLDVESVDATLIR